MDQELFNGEERTTIEDNENIAFRTPSNEGSRVISWLNFKNLLKGAFVALVGDQIINGIKTFNSSPKVPDPSTDLEAVNLRTLNSKTSDPDSIKFNTSYEPVITQEGELWWNGKEYTINIDTGLGATIQVGQEVLALYYNGTGSIISNFKSLHPIGSQDIGDTFAPTVEFADASDHEKCQGTLLVATHEVAIGGLGLATRFGKARDGDTSLYGGTGQLWLSADGSGDLTGTKPEFPNYSISMGGLLNVDPVNGEIFVSQTTTLEDTFNDAWDGAVRETFNFRTDSVDGINVIGTLENVDPLLNLTMIFSDGLSTLDTTTAPLTIALTPGTDSNEQPNYVYIPISTKVLTLSTSGWPTTQHCRIAQLDIQSAATTQSDGGALGNQNTNDHIKKEDDNGHILHAFAWIREQPATMRKQYNSEATFDNTGGSGFVQMTSGVMLQAHLQTLETFSMLGGDSIRAWNDFSGNRPKLIDLAAITSYSDGSSWNNEWGKIVVWRVGNKTGEYAPVMFNLPSNGYNSEVNALADLGNYADYSIPDNFSTKAALIAAFTFRISGGVITYSTGYEDLRGESPATAGGGGGGGGGVTTYSALTDTANSRVGKAGQTVVVNQAELADEYEPKGWFYNIARTFKLIFNTESLTADRTATWQDKAIIVAGLDDIPTQDSTPIKDSTNNVESGGVYSFKGQTNLTFNPLAIDLNTAAESWFNEYTQIDTINISEPTNFSQGSSFAVKIATNGDPIILPSTWRRIKNDYLSEIADFGFVVFYDGNEWQYSLYKLEATPTDQLIAPVIASPTMGTTTADLTWTDPNTSPQESFVNVYYKETSSSTWILYSTEAVGTISKQVAGLSNSISYDFSVIAVGDGITTISSSRSNTASGTTGAGSSTAAIEAIASLQHLTVAELNADFTLSGTNVDVWLDRSTEGNDFAKLGSTYKVFDLSNKKVITDVNTDTVEFATLLQLTGDHTVVLYEFLTYKDTLSVFVGNDSAAYIGESTASRFIYNAGNEVAYFNKGTVPTGVRKHFIKRDGGTVTWELNGVTLTVESGTDTGNTGTLAIKNLGFSTFVNNGDNKALAIFNTALDNTDKATVLDTLDTVFGL